MNFIPSHPMLYKHAQPVQVAVGMGGGSIG